MDTDNSQPPQLAPQLTPAALREIAGLGLAAAGGGLLIGVAFYVDPTLGLAAIGSGLLAGGWRLMTGEE